MKIDADDSDADEAPMTGIVLRQFTREGEAEGESIMREIGATARGFDGYLGYEVYPPVPGVQEGHVVIYRYASNETLLGWLNSEERRRYLARLEPLLARPATEFHFAGRRHRAGTHSAVLAFRIRPGLRAAFAEWRRRISEEVRGWPGYLGTEAFESMEDGEPHFIAVVRFDSREHLASWMGSEVRQQFLKEVASLVDCYEVRRTGVGFEGWFEFGAQPRPAPARWRQWLMIIAALFPLITLLKALMSPLFKIWPQQVAFLLLIVVDVAILTFFLMPAFSRVMDFWLRPKPGATWWTEVAGLGILVAIVAVTLAVTM